MAPNVVWLKKMAPTSAEKQMRVKQTKSHATISCVAFGLKTGLYICVLVVTKWFSSNTSCSLPKFPFFIFCSASGSHVGSPRRPFFVTVFTTVLFKWNRRLNKWMETDSYVIGSQIWNPYTIGSLPGSPCTLKEIWSFLRKKDEQNSSDVYVLNSMYLLCITSENHRNELILRVVVLSLQRHWPHHFHLWCAANRES